MSSLPGPTGRGDGIAASTSPRLDSAHPEFRSEPAKRLGREGMVTVWDDEGRYVGCMGVEAWAQLLMASEGLPVTFDKRVPQGETFIVTERDTLCELVGIAADPEKWLRPEERRRFRDRLRSIVEARHG